MVVPLSAHVPRPVCAPAESGEDPQIIEKLRRRVAAPDAAPHGRMSVAADLPEKNDVRVNVPLTAAHRHIYDMHSAA